MFGAIVADARQLGDIARRFGVRQESDPWPVHSATGPQGGQGVRRETRFRHDFRVPSAIGHNHGPLPFSKAQRSIALSRLGLRPNHGVGTTKSVRRLSLIDRYLTKSI